MQPTANDNTDHLIHAALTNGLGEGKFEIIRIECVDAHLHGHAFKYREHGQNITGVYPYRIDYRLNNGTTHTVNVMLKAKPDQAAIIAVYQGLLDQCGIKLRTPLTELLKNSDYCKPNLKEAVLFRDFASSLQPYLPASLGVYIDPATSYVLRLEEILPNGSGIIDPDDDTTQSWVPSFGNLALQGVADINARFYNNYQPLLDTGYIFVCDQTFMTHAQELWRAFYDFLCTTYADLMIPAQARPHRKYLDDLSDWYAKVDQQPKTLLYGDVNPQNLAFARTATGFQLSLFDWERALVSLPQRDLAEHLIYTLPDNFDKPTALEQIAIYRAAFDRRSTVAIDKDAFFAGLVWMLRDLIINRLPLMLIVKHVAGKRRHADAAYAKAGLLLSYLT